MDENLDSLLERSRPMVVTASPGITRELDRLILERSVRGTRRRPAVGRRRRGAIIASLLLCAMGGAAVGASAAGIPERLGWVPDRAIERVAQTTTEDGPVSCETKWRVTSSRTGDDYAPTVAAAREYLATLDTAGLETDPELLETVRSQDFSNARVQPSAAQLEAHAFTWTVTLKVWDELRSNGFDPAPIMIESESQCVGDAGN